jgi:hypothetical protein
MLVGSRIPGTQAVKTEHPGAQDIRIEGSYQAVQNRDYKTSQQFKAVFLNLSGDTNTPPPSLNLVGAADALQKSISNIFIKHNTN